MPEHKGAEDLLSQEDQRQVYFFLQSEVPPATTGCLCGLFLIRPDPGFERKENIRDDGAATRSVPSNGDINMSALSWADTFYFKQFQYPPAPAPAPRLCQTFANCVTNVKIEFVKTLTGAE